MAKSDMTQHYILWPHMPTVRDNVIRAVSDLESKTAWDITIKPYRKMRTDPQRAYLFGVVIPAIRAHLIEAKGVTAPEEDIYEELLQMFAPRRPPVIGEEYQVISVSKMDVAQMSQFIDDILRHMAGEGLAIPDAKNG